MALTMINLRIRLLLLLTLLIAPDTQAFDVPNLTPGNYSDITDGYTVFVKFFAPWCGHSKKMAPDWERLAEKWADSKVGIIAEVDCTGVGKPLCDANGVKKFPTLKYGDPEALESYDGPRSYGDLVSFAEERLIPLCSPNNLVACDEEKKKLIQEYQYLDAKEIESRIRSEKARIKQTQKSFDAAVDRLQKEYQALVQSKDKKIEDITSSHLRILNSIQKAQEKGVTSSKEEL